MYILKCQFKTNMKDLKQTVLNMDNETQFDQLYQ